MSLFAAMIHRQFIYEPPTPTASFKGKTIIVTGGNTGLGLEASRWFVRLGASLVIIACRDINKGKTAVANIQETTSCSPDTLQVWPLDLSSYTSIQAFANRAKVELQRLDAVLANAGMIARNFRITEQDEETITTNVVAPALLGFLLHPKLHETATRYSTQTHFTITGSELYEMAKFKESKAPNGKIFATLADEKKWNSDRYNVSKVLVLFVMKQLAEMAPVEKSNVIVNCIAPGYCKSGLGREYPAWMSRVMEVVLHARPTEVGARTLVHGVSAGPETHGMYVPDCKITPMKGLMAGKAGEELQHRVWLELMDKLEAIQPGVTTLPLSDR